MQGARLYLYGAGILTKVFLVGSDDELPGHGGEVITATERGGEDANLHQHGVQLPFALI